MPALIDEAQVRQVAKLARLELRDDEVQLFAGQLAAILEYVQQLDRVDTRGVEPLAHALPVRDVVRDDVAGATLDSAAALRNAPQREQTFFKVPAVLDGGGA
jgi:aspartyl-tRNA(Asn)/glutamyl-tRNA(Gln) amidotransferase subunit C